MVSQIGTTSPGRAEEMREEHDRPIGPVVVAPEQSGDEPSAAPASVPAWERLRPWLPVAAGTATAVLAFVVRIWRLDALGFNSDEAVYGGQAASLAGNPNYVDLFPVFRAHPMLFQAILSPFFRVGEVDVAGRVVVALFGVATVLAVYLVGARLYSRRVGLVAALLLAVMPYHVIVTRQVLLDGPMVLFATLTLYCVVRFVQDQKLVWSLAAGAMFGVTMLTKESSIVLAAGVYIFFALSPQVRRPMRAALPSLAVTVLVFATHPVSQALAGGSQTGKNYLVWQLFRRPNHDMGFYLQTVPLATGLLVVAAVIGGLWWLRRRNSWREILLLSWIAAPVIFFQLWPVKGFQYLLPAVAPVTILAARALLNLPLPGRLSGLRYARAARPAVIAVVFLSLLVPTWAAVNGQAGTQFLAGSGGVPGGRETGRWLATNTPAGSVVLTLGPSMANIIQYYGHRRCYGLSVSPNPLHRNPSYPALSNPDRWMRHSELQYVVWDSFSASRSPFFSERLLTLTRRYHGRVVHTEYVQGTDASGNATRIPVAIVYEVRP
jgi:hypothetical protein